MTKTKTKMKSQSFTCSNPECGFVFDNPIIVQDLSSKDQSSYYACPQCLTEIMIDETSEVEEKKPTQKKKTIKTEDVEAQLAKVEPDQPAPKEHKCPHHFGYLSQRSKQEKIPEECMTCEKIVQCMLKNVTR